LTATVTYLSREGLGYNIEVMVDPNPTSRCEIQGATTVPRKVNLRALEVMKKIATIHARMNPRPGKSSVELIREARAGAMYE